MKFKRLINLYKLIYWHRGHVIADLIKKNNLINVVEVGVFNGCTAEFVLKRCPNVSYIGVDSYKHKDTVVTFMPMSLNQAKDEAFKIFCKYPSAKLLISDSLKVAREFKDGELDLVFLDADHTYKAVKKDIAAWWPKIKKGGILAGHDFSLRHIGVVNAVVEKFEHSVNTGQDHTWWVKKI